VMVVAISEFTEGGPQFLEIVESAEPQDLFFEGAKEALDTPVRWSGLFGQNFGLS
jgi:hypothetical protein